MLSGHYPDVLSVSILAVRRRNSVAIQGKFHMMRNCAEIWGGSDITDSLLSTVIVRDVLYIPRDQAISAPACDHTWGCYDIDGNIIENSVYKRGVDRAAVCQTLTYIPRQAYTEISSSFLFYGGLLHNEYGHFIISTLSRLWALQYFAEVPIVVFHSHMSVEEIFKVPFILEIFEAIGIKKSNCAVFDCPVIVKSVMFAGEAMIEQHSATPEFIKFTKNIGNKLGQSRSKQYRTQSPKYVYFSKERLKNGVRNISNEAEVSNALSKMGVIIVYPESLSVSEQIDLFNRSSASISLLGSVLHGSAFASRKCTLIGYSHIDSVNSNFVIIDKLKGNNALYLYGEDYIYEIEKQEGFSQTLRIKNPGLMAEELFDIALKNS
jgi:capsular polysaccharide biosynthesis protein